MKEPSGGDGARNKQAGIARRLSRGPVGAWKVACAFELRAGTLAGVGDVDAQGRPEPPLAGDEVATLLGFLDFQRATFAWKCANLDQSGLNARVGVSTMTLGGMLKHLALVEDGWLSRSLTGAPRHAPFDAVDWQADSDWEWHTAGDDPPDVLFALWEESVERSRTNVAAALAAGGLDQHAARGFPDGRSPTLRWILCHMIEEYARHNGHADLLRETIDGETGE